MPEAASSVATWSTEQMMLEMVQVRMIEPYAAILQISCMEFHYFYWEHPTEICLFVIGNVLRRHLEAP
jgi:hypothetical protein